jgi:hypothetical protein
VTFQPRADELWGFGDYDSPELVMNGVDDDGIEWVLGPVEGWGRTSAATPLTEGGDDGGWFGPGRRRPRVMTLQGAFRSCGGSLDDAEQRLRDALERWESDQLLWVGGAVPKQVGFRLTGDLDVDLRRRNPNVRTFTAVVTAADPLKYAAGAAGLVSLSTGLPLPPTDYGLAANNPGGVPVYPKVTFRGPGSNLRLNHLEKGETAGYAWLMLDGQTVEFDHAYRTIIGDGRSLYMGRVSGNTFFRLERGQNSLSFQGDAYNANALVTVEYRPAWP